jgi:hypothetical protein
MLSEHSDNRNATLALDATEAAASKRAAEIAEMESIPKGTSPCGHPARFSFKHTDHTSYGDNITTECWQCIADRWHKTYDKEWKAKHAYHSLRECMDIDSQHGTKIVMWFPTNGYDYHGKLIEKLGIKLGQVCTVDFTEVHSSSTDLYIVEYPGELFNPVNWGIATPADMLTIIDPTQERVPK